MATNRRGVTYEPVTTKAILHAVGDGGRTSLEIGQQLWPHLDGHGPTTGGPCSCSVAATFALSKLEKAGRVWSTGRPRQWFLNDKGDDHA